MNIKSALGAAIAAGGVALLVFGMREQRSFASEVSEVFTGSPTDQAMWLIIGGVAAIVFGGALAFSGRGR